MSWGDELRAFRVRNNLKQEAAAQLLGVSQAYISRLENCAAAPSRDLEARLNRLLTEPAHWPIFDHFKAVVMCSPHLVFLLSYDGEEAFIEAASRTLMVYGPPFSGLRTGRSPQGVVGGDARTKMQQLIEHGAFRGQLGCMDFVWSCAGDQGEPSWWHTVMVPARKESGQWFLHGTLTPISRERRDSLVEDWGDSMKFYRYEELMPLLMSEPHSQTGQ
jgi:transcriptional regulator with XRE-family HTH domain